MDRRKIRTSARRLWRLALVVALLGGGRQATAVEWRTWTSQKEARSFTLIDDTLWAATSGGLLAVSDGAEPGRCFTNVDGLGTTDVYDIIEDASGQKWVAAMGRLVRFSVDDSRQFLFFDEDRKAIGLTSLADDGDQLWVATSIGLVLFSKTIDGGQIQDSYGRFGSLPDFPEVNQVLVAGDSVWLVTSAGLATGDITDPVLLKSRFNWTVFEADQFGGHSLNRIARFDSAFYVATSGGLYRLEIIEFDTTITRIDFGVGLKFCDLAVTGDSLLLFFESGLGGLVDGVPSFIATPGLPGAPTTGLSFSGQRWLAVPSKGVFYEDGDAYTEYPFTGLPNNTVSDITVNRHGVITAAFTKQPAATLVDDVWFSYDLSVREGTTLLISDSSGSAWLGTRGNGIWLLQGDSAVNYDEQNSTLRGNPDPQSPPYDFVLINGLATDGRYLFAACYRALNGYPVAVADLAHIDDPTGGWDSIGVDDGLDHTFVTSLDYVPGYIAVGNEFNGVYVCNVGSDPFDRPESSCIHYSEDNSFLRSDAVRVVRFAPGGVLWVGTNSGLSRYDSGIERFVDVDLPAGIDRDITDLEFDGRGNLWIGTRGGLARLDATTGRFDNYTTANSDLVADRINALTLDMEGDDLYIATTAGISLFISPVNRIVFDPEEVVAFPNPFVIRSSQDSLAFNFGRPATVHIHTVAGELVRTLDVNSGWFGDNQSGELVASGVYIFVLEDHEGNVKRVKVLLVRE